MTLLVTLLAAPLLLVALGSSPASAATLCLAQRDKTACVSGTVGSRADPVEGADVLLLDESGAEVDTQTTEADGKFAFTLTEPGTYFVRLDNETLPEGLEEIPPATEALTGPDDSLKVEVKLGRTVVPALTVRPVDYDASGTSKSDQLIESTFNGIKLGLLLALASLGLSLIYGTTGLSNFAHAEQVTLGGVVAFYLISAQHLGLNLWLGIFLTTLICAGSGLLQDVVMWKPLRRRGLGLTQLLVVTIGFSLALQYSFQYAIGASQVKVTLQTFKNISFGPVDTNSISLIAMGVAVVAIMIVGYVLLRTRLGQATRAVSDNPALAAASGHRRRPDRPHRVDVVRGPRGTVGRLLRAVGLQRHPVGHRLPDPAAALRGGHARRPRHRLRRPRGLADHRAGDRARRSARGPRRPEVRGGARHADRAAAVPPPGPARPRRPDRLRGHRHGHHPEHPQPVAP